MSSIVAMFVFVPILDEIVFRLRNHLAVFTNGSRSRSRSSVPRTNDRTRDVQGGREHFYDTVKDFFYVYNIG